MKQMSQKRADQKLAKELKSERKKANKAAEEKKKTAPSVDRPAYYDSEGGSMCNGLGRNYF